MYIWYMKAFWYYVDSSLFKSWSPGFRRGNNRQNHTHMCLNCLLQNQQNNFNLTRYKSSLGKNNSKLYKKGPGHLQRGDNHKSAKIWRGHLKIVSLRTTEPEELLIFMKAFWQNVDKIQVCSNHGPRRVRRGYNRKSHIYMCLYKKK
jgi:hypothetical protein